MSLNHKPLGGDSDVNANKVVRVGKAGTGAHAGSKHCRNCRSGGTGRDHIVARLASAGCVGIGNCWIRYLGSLRHDSCSERDSRNGHKRCLSPSSEFSDRRISRIDPDTWKFDNSSRWISADDDSAVRRRKARSSDSADRDGLLVGRS